MSDEQKFKSLLKRIKSSPEMMKSPDIDEEIATTFLPELLTTHNEDVFNYIKSPSNFKLGPIKESEEQLALQLRDIYGKMLNRTIVDEEPELDLSGLSGKERERKFKKIIERFKLPEDVEFISSKKAADLAAEPHGEFKKSTEGLFVPSNKSVYSNDKLNTFLHEMGHKKDSDLLETLGKNQASFSIPESIKKSSMQDTLSTYGITEELLKKHPGAADELIKQLSNPSSMLENVSGQHHLRGVAGRSFGPFEKFNVYNYLKSGSIKALPYIGPLLGGLSAVATDDASAAIPILNEADDLGAPQSSPEGKFERGELSGSELKKFRSFLDSEASKQKPKRFLKTLNKESSNNTLE